MTHLALVARGFAVTVKHVPGLGANAAMVAWVGCTSTGKEEMYSHKHSEANKD